MSQSFGLLVGPAIGGILYEQGGYFNTFIPAFVLIVIEIALRFLVVVRKRDRSQKMEEVQEPSEASILAKDCTANPPYGTTLPPETELPQDADLENNNRKSIIQTSSDRPTTPQPTSTNPPSASSSTIKTIYLLLTSPRILTALLALFILNTILTSYDATIPVHIRSTFTLPSSRASFLFLILVSPFSLAPLAGLIIDHRGPYIPCTLGFLVLVPPVFILQMIDSPTCCSSTITPFLALALCLFTIGLGTAFVQPALMSEISLVIENIECKQPGCFGEKGVVAFAFGVMNFAFAGGFLVGPLLAGALVEGWGWRGMNVTLGWGGVGCLIVVGALTGGKWKGRWGKREKVDERER
ncbi:MAG: hypothetical protein Q9186_007316 [Xanthomendoza sp. 1 TL-2023]